jgi:NAD(P)-dependent dehydrogenase (short-subunit alcohol dehydrogenase family)
VTGAASGIGLEAARQFIEEGATVIGVDLNEVALEAATNQLGERFIPKVCDVSKEPQIASLAADFADQCGHLDALVNNAGSGKFVNVLEMTEEDYDFHFGVLLKGPMFFVRHFAPGEKTPAPSIINIASTVACVVMPNHFLYSSAKLALEKFTRHMVLDLPGIRSNSILPGWIHIGILKAAGLGEQETADILAMIVKHVPTGRIGKPTDIASCVLFLCSEKASYINGASIIIDGGWVCAGDFAG